MPLLGRHKSSSPTGSAQSSNANTTSSPTSSSRNQQRQAVCESPLFGVRKQLQGSSVGTSSKSSSAKGATSETISSSPSSPTNSTHELSSIPQQITRQQIHYAFTIMDNNKDGMIDLRDLSQMLANLGVPIDEAILSHIMSTVSKRGDHRISETEFLDWIALFIQVSDSEQAISKTTTTATGRQRTTGADSSTGHNHQLGGGTRRNNNNQIPSTRNSMKAARSSTGSTSLAHSVSLTNSSMLAAQPSEPSLPRTRRGSGSGLALMRSLSSSSSGSMGSPSAAVEGLQSSSDGSGGKQQQQHSAATTKSTSIISQADQEARDDLKAAFLVFDLDGDGFITLDEVQAGLKLLGESWSPSELRQLFTRCPSSRANDLSKQRISIDEFVHLLL